MTIQRKPKQPLPRPKGVTGGKLCGFCETEDHSYCPVAIKNGTGKPGEFWLCPCSLQNPDLHPNYTQAATRTEK